METNITQSAADVVIPGNIEELVRVWITRETSNTPNGYYLTATIHDDKRDFSFSVTDFTTPASAGMPLRASGQTIAEALEGLTVARSSAREAEKERLLTRLAELENKGAV